MPRSVVKTLLAVAIAGAAFLATTVTVAAPVLVYVEGSFAIVDRQAPPVGEVLTPINLPAVSQPGLIKDVNVYVRGTHTAVGDLKIVLRNGGADALSQSDDTTATLIERRGGTGDDLGSGATDCNGTPTLFDDSAATALAGAVAPFDGASGYKPEQALSAFNGKPATGQWTLEVTDTATGETGTLHCVDLEIDFLNAELELKTLTATPSPAFVDGDVTYVASAKNNGADRSGSSTLTFTVPTGMTVKSLTSTRAPDVDKCQITAPVKCDLAGIDPGATLPLTLVLTAKEAGAKKVVAKLTPSDSAPPNEEKDITVDVKADASGGTEIVRITTLGLGRGTVTSAPLGINCGMTCEAGFVKGGKVTLTATPSSTSHFAGWGGACTGVAIDAPCEVTADGVKEVTAKFDKGAGGGGGGGNEPPVDGGGTGGTGGTYDICTKTGTSGNDRIKGTPRADVICGFGGNDTIYGLGGGDRIYGGGGNDKLFGGAGNDKLYGGGGIDTLNGGKGADKGVLGGGDSATSVEAGI
jgi:subtilisin-like proprotein convertase family protein